MSHRAQRAFCEKALALYPRFARGADVLDVGSRDVNGTNRYLFSGGSYFGVDLVAGPNVDLVGAASDAPGDYDVVISTEMLEHDQTWERSIRSMCSKVRRYGMLILTCAGPGRPEHGTRANPYPGEECSSDYYRNLSVADVLRVVTEFDWVEIMAHANGQACDTYVCAVR